MNQEIQRVQEELQASQQARDLNADHLAIANVVSTY